jgi:hypothetical protein
LEGASTQHPILKGDTTRLQEKDKAAKSKPEVMSMNRKAVGNKTSGTALDSRTRFRK